MKAAIKMENGGEMVFELFSEKAPITVKNFLELLDAGYYKGKDFYRVVSGWVIQAGKLAPGDERWKGHSITGEFAENGFDTGLSHVRGTLSMARKPDDYNSGGLEIFITHRDTPELDGRYAAFGVLIRGFDVLDAIASVPVEEGEPLPGNAVNLKPLVSQTIKSITLED
jgi:cyclophilin family peptidyl-prolyl cis-trans isomerase